MNQWIPLPELPNKNMHVLVTVKMFGGELEVMPDNFVNGEFEFSAAMSKTQNANVANNQVIAWMAWPEPYTGNETWN